jgi:hypothetical protein
VKPRFSARQVMKARSVAVSVGLLAGFLLCSGPYSFAQEKREALIVGITGEWAADVRPDAEKDRGSPKTPESLPNLSFLSTILVDTNTCVYGTGGYLAIQFDKDVLPVSCKPASDSGCNDKAKARLSKPVVCSCHIEPPKPEGSGGYVSLDSTFPFFHLKEATARYVTPVSRGLESELRDAVVQLRDGKVDLTPVFSDLDSGSYKIRVEALKGGGASPMTAVVAWQEGGSAIATIPGIATGLFRVSRVESHENSPAPEAWVLVCAPGEFADKSAAYGAAVDATRKWPSEVDARAPQAVLRAYLDALSRGPAKGTGK